MKNQLLLRTLLFILPFHLLAQDTSKIEKWYNGSLKNNLVLKNGDTLYLEQGYENGQIALKRWGKDSLYAFGYGGNILTKMYGSIMLSNLGWRGDSTINFNYQGEIETIRIDMGKNRYKFLHYEGNALVFQQISFDRHYENLTNENKLWSKGRYNIMASQQEDTLFYTNGKIKSVIHGYDYGTIRPSFWQIFDKNGDILYASEGNDIITPEKDNGECLYGFRNSKGEWVIPPQYENIKPIGMQYVIVSDAHSAVIINQRGEKLENTSCDFLDILAPLAYCPPAMTYRSKSYAYNYPEFIYEQIMFKLDFENATVLKFRKNGLYGVMDIRGNILLPPQYQNVRKHSAGIFEVQIGKKWGVVNGSGKILVQPEHYEVNFTQNPHIFIISDTSTHLAQNYYPIRLYGLANDSSRVILPKQFDYISPAEDATFVLRDKNYKEYVFSCEKGYIIDTSYSINYIHNSKIVIVSSVKQSQPNKSLHGLANLKGEMLLPVEYLHVSLFNSQDNSDNLFLIQTKDRKYGIYNITEKAWSLQPEWDYISVVPYFLGNGEYHFPIYHREFMRPLHIFAQKGRKYSILKSDFSVVTQGDLDYFGYDKDIHSSDGLNFMFLVKDKKLHFYSAHSFPLECDFRQNYDFSVNKMFTLKTVNDTELLFNQNGELLVPPQYKVKSIVNRFAIVEDIITQKQKLLTSDGSLKDFLPQYRVLKAYIDKNLIVVEHPQTKKVGVVNSDGKIVIPADNFAVSVSVKDDAIWVRKDFPTIPKDSFLFYNEFELSALDTLWQLYNSSGKLLTATVFQKPFPFYQSVGIGMTKNKMGLWSKNGETILPPQYKHILRDTTDNISYLMQQKADSTLAFGFADSTGCIIKEAHFTTMSRFFGNYAFVSQRGFRGVIDKQGNWLCPLSAHSIPNFKGSLIDSLLVRELKDTLEIMYRHIQNRTQIIFDNTESIRLGMEYNLHSRHYFDSLTAVHQRIAMNCILDAVMPTFSLPTTSFLYERLSDSLCISPLFINNIINDTRESYWHFRHRRNYDEKPSIYDNGRYSHSNILLKGFQISDNYVNIILETNRPANAYLLEKIKYSQNYHLKSGVWHQIEMEEIIDLSATNISKINTLLLSKIKEIRSEDLDCGNGLSFFEAGRKLCFINEQGIVFQYERKKETDDYEFESQWRLIPVICTWQELQAFIKPSSR